MNRAIIACIVALPCVVLVALTFHPTVKSTTAPVSDLLFWAFVVACVGMAVFASILASTIAAFMQFKYKSRLWCLLWILEIVLGISSLTIYSLA